METQAHTEAEKEVLPAVDYLLELLVQDPTGKEQYTVVDGAYQGMEIVLEALFTAPVDPRPTLDHILRLACALEVELRSPSAAALLMSALKADPRVAETCRGQSDRNRFSNNAEMERWGVQGEIKQAPMFGEGAAEGTIKAGSLADAASRARPKNASPVQPRSAVETKRERPPVARRPIRYS